MSLKNNWKPKTDDDYVEAEDINLIAEVVIELEKKIPSGGVNPDGTPIIIDDQMSPDSENPVQNKVIFAYVEEQNNNTKGIALGSAQMAQQANQKAEGALSEAQTASEMARNAESIAKGRATGYVFDTEEDMLSWVGVETNKAKLVLGDNLYIRELGVPDYWWDGTTIQPLETQKVDLTEYATIEYVGNTRYMIEGQIAGVNQTATEAKQKAQEVATALPNYAKTEDVNGKVAEHNTSDESHNDIRLLVQGLTNRLNALADSDDSTLDQLSEVVAYIKNNKDLIDGVTTSKINISDIVDNLTTSASNKPLSAKQGVILKGLIDSIVVPTLLSQLGQDATHRLVTDAEKQTWNNKSDFGGKFSDLTNRPTTLDGYGITDGATKTDLNNLSKEVDGKQPKGNYAVKSEIPTKTSQLENDSKFLTSVPSGYAKSADHYTKTESDGKYQPKGNYLTIDTLPKYSGEVS